MREWADSRSRRSREAVCVNVKKGFVLFAARKRKRVVKVESESRRNGFSVFLIFSCFQPLFELEALLSYACLLTRFALINVCVVITVLLLLRWFHPPTLLIKNRRITLHPVKDRWPNQLNSWWKSLRKEIFNLNIMPIFNIRSHG